MSHRFYSLTTVRVRVSWNVTPPRFIDGNDVLVTDVLKFRNEDEDSIFLHKIG
jgi:hypothetical protein